MPLAGGSSFTSHMMNFTLAISLLLAEKPETSRRMTLRYFATSASSGSGGSGVAARSARAGADPEIR